MFAEGYCLDTTGMRGSEKKPDLTLEPFTTVLATLNDGFVPRNPLSDLNGTKQEDEAKRLHQLKAEVAAAMSPQNPNAS